MGLKSKGIIYWANELVYHLNTTTVVRSFRYVPLGWLRLLSSKLAINILYEAIPSWRRG